MSRLKDVTNKLQADEAIDELQDILYKGNKDMTIPLGSKEDKILKRILGQYNDKLKSGLPQSYRNLNKKISDKLDSLDTLNKSLGEVVEGVPIRGASLIKQYFSPAGTKAQKLFEFVKKNTGYDVASDAAVARYMSEIYEDPRVRSLLEGGIPMSQSGVIDKATGFIYEKTGLGGAVQQAVKKASIQKARKLTK